MLIPVREITKKTKKFDVLSLSCGCAETNILARIEKATFVDTFFLSFFFYKIANFSL